MYCWAGSQGPYLSTHQGLEGTILVSVKVFKKSIVLINALLICSEIALV